MQGHGLLVAHGVPADAECLTDGINPIFEVVLFE